MPQPSPAPDRFLDLLRRRIVVAPKAGGPTTTDLVIAAARAGALGFLAAGYKTPAAMTARRRDRRPAVRMIVIRLAERAYAAALRS